MIKHLLSSLLVSVMFCSGALAIECGKIPYSIQTRAGGAELNIAVPESVRSRLGAISATTGGEFVKSTFASVSQIAMSELLDYYQCAINSHVATKDIPADKKIVMTANLARGIDSIRRISAIYFAAFASEHADWQMAISDKIEQTVRLADTPVYDRTILEEAIGEQKINTVKTFQEATLVKGWGSANLNGIQVTACGGYLRAALSQNAGIIQGAVSNTRSILFDYLDGSRPEMIQSALSKLFLVASSSSTVVVPAVPPYAESIRNCSKQS